MVAPGGREEHLCCVFTLKLSQWKAVSKDSAGNTQSCRLQYSSVGTDKAQVFSLVMDESLFESLVWRGEKTLFSSLTGFNHSSSECAVGTYCVSHEETYITWCFTCHTGTLAVVVAGVANGL